MKDDWFEGLEEGRKEKDRYFATEHSSPIPHEDRAKFCGLNYFPPDAKYSIKTKLYGYDRPRIILMTTSKGTNQKFYEFGYFDFEIGGHKAKLQAYKSAEREDKELFVPFRDKTSGNESYPAARYLDLRMSDNDQYMLDFNFAYNPYCAYSDDYVCPLPPKENWLDIEIRAGEKKYNG